MIALKKAVNYKFKYLHRFNFRGLRNISAFFGMKKLYKSYTGMLSTLVEWHKAFLLFLKENGFFSPEIVSGSK
jgi:hypothetical protein